MPFLTPNIFDRKMNVEIVKHVDAFTEKFDKFPTASESKLDMTNSDAYEHLIGKCLAIDTSEYVDEFILSKIEQHVRSKLIFNVCADVTQGLDSPEGPDQAYIDKLREAYSFSFDTKLGLDIFDEAERMYEFFHSLTNFVPSNIDNYDTSIGGGFHSKTLTLFLAGCVTTNTKVKIRVRRKK